MENKEAYARTRRSLRRVWRLTWTLSAIPKWNLYIECDDIPDAEYVTEWLHIVLCRICVQPDISMPHFDESASLLRQFRWCIRKAKRQVGAIRRGLLLGRINKSLFAERAWDGLDSAEIFLQSFLSSNVQLKRRRYK